jgi:hypothetical protein
MRIERISEFDRSGAAVADLLFDPQAMTFLLQPIVSVQPLTAFPPCWDSGRYHVAMSLFGIIPLGWQGHRGERISF